MLRRRIAWLAPPAVVLLGVALFALLLKSRPRPQRAASEPEAVLVQTQPAIASTQQVKVRALGTVRAAQRVELSPEVSGRVVWQSPELVPGGRLRRGEALLRIDPRDYELAVEERRANVDRANVELQLERGQRVVAERAWELLGEDGADTAAGGDARALALRQPQLRAAMVAARAAESGLKRAELNLERTTLRSPFNAVVLAESVDVGQVVGPQTRVATLAGSDEAWVQVSVPASQLSRITVPVNAEDAGARARIWQRNETATNERSGHVVRLLGDVDPAGLMARLLVAIEDPFGLLAETRQAAGDAEPVPLLLGSYVTVEVEAGELENVVEVQRVAVHEGNKVYVALADGTLGIRRVKIAWRRPDSVLVAEGLVDGERIVTSRIPTPIPGMRLRLESSSRQLDGELTAARAVR
jgi:RND family efflux transporter MFP subunit